MPTKTASKSSSNKKIRKPSTWMKACQKAGFMKKGADFKPIPAKGTKDYNEIKKIQENMDKK
jgi:hypothetical protein